MADQTSGEIDIKATPEEVLDVIVDFDAYPKWAGGVRKCEVLKRDSKGRPTEVYMEVSSSGISSKQTLKYSYKARNAGLTWTSTKAEGAAKSVQGEYGLKATDDGTHVRYSTKIEAAIPLPGFMKRQAERTIVDTALNGLKKRVEKG
jgi:carbon monoxide dehydrogenase subunit G